MWGLVALLGTPATFSPADVGPSFPYWPHLPEETLPMAPKRTAGVHTRRLTHAPDPFVRSRR
jgi:hypothetical protein